MRLNGWEGVRRVKKVRTTVAKPSDQRALDLVNAVPGFGAVGLSSPRSLRTLES
jgi:hypothetical protein